MPVLGLSCAPGSHNSVTLTSVCCWLTCPDIIHNSAASQNPRVTLEEFLAPTHFRWESDSSGETRNGDRATAGPAASSPESWRDVLGDETAQLHFLSRQSSCALAFHLLLLTVVTARKILPLLVRGDLCHNKWSSREPHAMGHVMDTIQEGGWLTILYLSWICCPSRDAPKGTFTAGLV